MLEPPRVLPSPRVAVQRPQPIPRTPWIPGSHTIELLPDPPEIRPWLAIAPALRMRPTVRSTVAGVAWGGVVIRERIRLGLGLEVSPPVELLWIVDEQHLRAVDLCGIALYSAGPWEVGPVGGLSLRTIESPQDDPIPTWIPLAGGAVAHRLDTGAVPVRIALGVTVDVVPTRLTVDQVDQGALGSVGASLSVGISTR